MGFSVRSHRIGLAGRALLRQLLRPDFFFRLGLGALRFP
jgi:hypothetical protein